MTKQKAVPVNTRYPVSRPSIGDLELAYVSDAVQSGWVSSTGPYIDRFESDFATFCGTSHAVAVANGTCGLHLALLANGVGAGDEVIVPDLTFVATANAVQMAGARPVLVDVDRETLCINPKLIDAAITERTKAIIPVHLYGHPADMLLLNAAARRHGLIVIEDAAEAHGAEFQELRVGQLGQCAVFSFFGNKILTTGEGGAVTTNDENFAERCRHLRDHAMGSDKKYTHTELGYNYRMTNLQAALGCAQIERAGHLLRRRQFVFQSYSARLEHENRVRLNRTAHWAKNAYWMVCLELEDPKIDRDVFALKLRCLGIETRPYFHPLSDMPHLPNAYTPVTHAVASRGICLPTYADLEEQDIAYIADAIIQILKE